LEEDPATGEGLEYKTLQQILQRNKLVTNTLSNTVNNNNFYKSVGLNDQSGTIAVDGADPDHLAGLAVQVDAFNQLNENSFMSVDLLGGNTKDLIQSTQLSSLSYVMKSRAEKQQARIDEAERKKIEAGRRAIDAIEIEIKE